MTGEHDYDFAVIGGGSAGYAAARTAAGLGLKTAVIDGAEELGGLCILRGCMPSKTLIHSANVAMDVRNAGEFGVRASQGQVDTAAIRQRKRRLIGEFAGYRQGQLTDGRFALLRGMAQFNGPNTLEVQLRDGGSLTVKAQSVLIATGSVISWPELPGLREANVWTSDTALDAETVPDSFIVLGGGAIALEMAHYLEGIGRKVTVIQRGAQLLRGMDADLAEVVRESFTRRGMMIHTGTKLKRVETQDGRKSVVFEEKLHEHTAAAAEILLALGRRAAVDGLNLETAGVMLEGGHVAVTSTMQTTVPHIYAAGDVCGDADVVHVAVQQGEMAARNAAKLLSGTGPLEQMDYRLRLFGVFTEPQVASVGMNEADAKLAGRSWRAASYPFNDHGKSMVMSENEGFVKMIADTETGEILGASVVGPEATELIHQVVVAMHFRCTVKQFLEIPFYHPTLSEIWSYPAEDLL
ncbi:MAG TPA: FAD-dependent oxidoreductase [Verrucomicrobiales bacterium]|nr:FAD-dependent oxidoreductase [Verrucomicrobiales bacterium]